MDFSNFAFEFQWEQCFCRIDKWKKAMIEHITNIHKEKLAEIQMYKEQAERTYFENENYLILNMNEYFQHTSILSNEINSFKIRLNQLKNHIIHRPLPLNIEINSPLLNNSILIHPVFEKHLFEQRKIYVEYQVDKEDIRFISTSNNQIILVNNQSIIYLYDKRIGFIDQISMSDYTDEYLNGICWSSAYKNFLFVFNYSLWSLENVILKKLAHISRKRHFLNNLTSFHNYLFLVYDQGEFIDRWTVEPEWKLTKRWGKQRHNDDYLISMSSNNNYLLLYSNKSIELCTDDLIIKYYIDLLKQKHCYSNFIFLETYKIWLTIDKTNRKIYYFNENNQIIQTFDQIYFIGISPMGSNELAIVTENDYHLQIVSI